MSNGARIALSYASKFPKEVCGVVACNTFDKITPLIKAKLKSWLLAHDLGGPLHRFDIATPWIWGEDSFNEKSEIFLSYREKAKNLDDHAVRGLLMGAMETDICIENIKVPLLFVAGHEDLLTPPFLHQKMQLKAHHGEFKIAEGGHAGLIERPDIMEKQILPWIQKIL